MSKHPFILSDGTLLVEALKDALCSANHEVEESLAVISERSRNWPTLLTPSVLREEIVCTGMEGRPALTPSRRRFAATMLRRWEEESSTASHEKTDSRAPELPTTPCENSHIGEQTTPHIPPYCPTNRKVGKSNPAIVEMIKQFCLSEGSVTQLWRDLCRAANMPAASRVLRRTLAFLNSPRRTKLLSALGYCYADPTPQTVRFLRRLDLLPERLNRNTRSTYRELVERLAHAHQLPVPAIDYLLKVFTGAWRVSGFRAICTGHLPRCPICPFRSRCSFAKVQRQAAPQQRRPVKEWLPSERPRERLLDGRDLSDAELLAIILRTGTHELSAVELARRIIEIAGGNTYELWRLSPAALVERLRRAKIKGVGPAKIAQLRAALELGARALSSSTDQRLRVGDAVQRSRDIFERYRSRYAGATQEEFRILILDTKHRVVHDAVVSRGTLDASIVHPRDVFRLALDHAASAVIFVHNHPSGDPTPSREDRMLTRRLADAGQLLGIRVLDHVIIGAQTYFSFADEGELR
ncbi:MAG: DNA repair protein RadC [Candidatus Sumerlaeaceae bacterium]|nr:DNA repair protein RadC [Candidatus Sumerlaeaceae bacterium]